MACSVDTKKRASDSLSKREGNQTKYSEQGEEKGITKDTGVLGIRGLWFPSILAMLTLPLAWKGRGEPQPRMASD